MDALRIEREPESEAPRPVLLPELVNTVEIKVSGSSPEEEHASFWEHAVKREIRFQVS